MKNRNGHGILILAVVLVLQAMTILFAQEKKPFTRESMNDPEIRRAVSTFQVWWLEDNTAVMYDTRKPESERGLERFNPRTNQRKGFVDIKKAREQFKTLFPEGKVPGLSPVPTEIGRNGKVGLYIISGDLYIMDIPKASVFRITDTEEREENARLSPDCSKVAFVRGTDLYSYDLLARKETRLTFDGTETLLNGTLNWVYWEEIFGRQDIAFWWSGDSKALAYLQTDESEVSVQHYTDIAPWTPTVTEQRYPKVGEKNPEVRVGIVELESQKTTWAAIPPEAYEYIIRVDWVPGSEKVCVRTMNRLQTHLDFYLVDRHSGVAPHILTDSDEGWINISDDLYFLSGGKEFIISSERDGYEHLYRFAMDGRLVNQVTKGEWAIRSAGGGAFWVRQAVTGIDEKNGWIYFTALEKSFLEKHLYRVRLDGSRMERISQGRGTHRISMSPDARYYFDTYSNIETPPSVTLYRSDGKPLSVLAESNRKGLDKYDIQYPELFQVPARDGFMVSCYILKPKNPEPGRKYPVIVSVYGGPSAPQIADAFSLGMLQENLMLAEGYISMKIDNRAAMGVSKKLENLLLKRSPGEVELNDLVDAVRYMKKQPIIDPDRWGITGWSGGGTNTILAMTRSTEFKAGIAGAGVTDFRFYDSKWGEAMMKTEKENLQGYEDNSLLKYAKDLHGRLLLVHGTHDDNVHIQNTWRFIDELIKADKLFELMVYPMRKHGVGDPAARRHLNDVTMDFWKRNL